jgi:protein-disulfide isomerase
MENENKTEEKKTSAPEKEEIKKYEEYKKKICTIWKKHKKIIILVIVAVLFVAAALGAWAGWRKINIGPNAIKQKVQSFISANVPQGVKVEVKDVIREGELYKVTLSINDQNVPVYTTLDGKKLIGNTVDLDQKTGTDNQANNQVSEETQAAQKKDIPEVKLFVMSYCPYGLQIERGILPVIEALKGKIKFNLEFVGYTLHGQKEVDENINQYCIGKNQPAKLNAYLKCFWKNSAGNSDACMKAAGINASQIKNCVEDSIKQFNPTEKNFNLSADDVTQYGVQGSPALVVNGTTISSGRDSASLLKAVCSGFTTQPKECNSKLSSKSPAAGFDDQASGSTSTSASCGN